MIKEFILNHESDKPLKCPYCSEECVLYFQYLDFFLCEYCGKSMNHKGKILDE